MTPRQIATLAVRILALYCIINSLNWLQSTLTLLFFAAPSRMGHPTFNVLLAFLPFTVYCAFGVILWLFAETVGSLMQGSESLPDSDVLTSDSNMTQADWVRIALGCLGVWFAVTAFSNLTKVGLTHLLGDSLNRMPPRYPAVAENATSVVQLCIGLWLVFGAPGLVQIVRSARHVGRDPIPSEESHSD